MSVNIEKQAMRNHLMNHSVPSQFAEVLALEIMQDEQRE